MGRGGWPMEQICACGCRPPVTVIDSCTSLFEVTDAVMGLIESRVNDLTAF